jgi:hypothetical protein
MSVYESYMIWMAEVGRKILRFGQRLVFHGSAGIMATHVSLHAIITMCSRAVNEIRREAKEIEGCD